MYKILVKRNNKPITIEAHKVVKGDKIGTPLKLNIISQQNPVISDFVTENETSKANYPIDVNLSYFIGAMLGDGYSGSEISDGQLIYKGSAFIVNKDEEILEIVETCCKTLDLNCNRKVNRYGTPQIIISNALK